jgi:hypothetical protein
VVELAEQAGGQALLVQDRGGQDFRVAAFEWPCGADLSADTIEAHLKTVPPDIARQLNNASQQSAGRASRNAPSP